MNQEPFTVGSMTAREDHITFEFVTEFPTHRHFTMSFVAGDSAALDKALEDVAAAAIPLACRAMMDMLGDTSSPDDLAELVPDWRCRICDASAPAGTPGWGIIEFPSAVPGGLVNRMYCPTHNGIR